MELRVVQGGGPGHRFTLALEPPLGTVVTVVPGFGEAGLAGVGEAHVQSGL